MINSKMPLALNIIAGLIFVEAAWSVFQQADKLLFLNQMQLAILFLILSRVYPKKQS